MILKITGGETIIDDEVLSQISAISWHITGSGGYAVHSTWDGIRTGKLLMHRYVFELEGCDIPSSMQVDHINRNRLDNRFDNLRLVTVSQQRANSSYGNMTGFSGVVHYFYKGHEYYQGRITKDHRLYYTRNVGTPEEAAHLRDELAWSLYGSFAIQNFPKDVVI